MNLKIFFWIQKNDLNAIEKLSKEENLFVELEKVIIKCCSEKPLYVMILLLNERPSLKRKSNNF
jgi:hypothetical protein